MRFLINIFVPHRGPAEVRSCEMAGNKWRNRTSFTNARKVEDVFSPDIASGLYRLLGNISAKMRILSLPDHLVEVTGLVMGGIQLVTNFAEDGSAVVIMRFKHIIGGIQNAFVSAFGLSDPVAELRDDLAIEVLADLSMPLLDICSYVEALGVTEDQLGHPVLRSVAKHAGEIRFQVELIKRYLDRLEAEPVAVPVMAQPEPHALRLVLR